MLLDLVQTYFVFKCESDQLNRTADDVYLSRKVCRKLENKHSEEKLKAQDGLCATGEMCTACITVCKVYL